MKIAELNIGLSSKSLGEISPENVLARLKSHGFEVIGYRIAPSSSLDGDETCLACKVTCPDGWQRKIADVSAYFGQDCIAVVGFIGHDPYDTFAPDLWVSPEKTKVEFGCEGREFLAIESCGNLKIYEKLIESPRNKEDIETQALNELEDSGTFN